MQEVDDEFYDRADAHIHLSNEQVTDDIGAGKVSASMLYGSARFNAFICARSYGCVEDMKEGKSEDVDYFLAEYKKQLIENLDDYIDNFDAYIKSKRKDV